LLLSYADLLFLSLYMPTSVVKELVNTFKADVNLPDEDGNTPLHWGTFATA
jgi:ankyrin repeat protein